MHLNYKQLLTYFGIVAPCLLVQKAVVLQLVCSKILTRSVGIEVLCVFVIFEKSGEHRDRSCTKATPPFMQALRDLDTLL